MVNVQDCIAREVCELVHANVSYHKPAGAIASIYHDVYDMIDTAICMRVHDEINNFLRAQLE